MLTGINFSPPLYFLFNFCLQLVLPSSIEALRIQSLVCTIIGLVLCFVTCRRLWGGLPAIVGLLLVVCHSDLLLAQSQEARNYSLFFACGAWVLYMQVCNIKCPTRLFTITFVAHLCLCQVHYLGIIFSSLVGISYLFFRKEMFCVRRIPISIYTSWLISLPAYIYFLSKQKSLLNTWPKPNSFTDLIGVYSDGMITLFSLIPILAIGIITGNSLNKKVHFPKLHNPALLTSVLWPGIPLIVWALSHLTPINLFSVRYFIPQEAAFIFLISFIYSSIQMLFLNQYSKSKISNNAALISTTTICLLLFLINVKRSSFTYAEDRNYHHWLIKKDDLIQGDIPMILCGDPVFFPNAYQYPKKAYFLVDDQTLNSIYSQFSAKIKVLNYQDLNDFNSFTLVSLKNGMPKLNPSSFEITSLGKFHDRLPFFCTKFEKIESPGLTPPS
jgi:hypothetical protein